MKISKILKTNNVWISSDHHFGHDNICTFKDQNNEPLRPWDDVFEMEEELINRWNDKVQPEDYIICGGDISMNKTGFDRAINRLNGNKILILGNHDNLQMPTYLKHFKQVFSVLMIHGSFCITHIPVHPSSLKSNMINIHGHLHSHRVLLNENIDLRYVNVCVEQCDFYPVLLDDVMRDSRKLLLEHAQSDNYT